MVRNDYIAYNFLLIFDIKEKSILKVFIQKKMVCRHNPNYLFMIKEICVCHMENLFNPAAPQFSWIYKRKSLQKSKSFIL